MKEMRKLREQVEEKLKNILEQGVQGSNLDVLGKLVDIEKDLKEIECYDEKGEKSMNYKGDNEYENYSRNEYGRRGRDSKGRYTRRGNYRGEETIDEMYGAYQDYSENREEYERGNYGAQSATIESLEYMLESVVEFIKMLKKEANSQEEIKIIQKYTEKIANM